MNPTLVKWIKVNEHKTFSSPRKTVFGSNADNFTLIRLDMIKEKVHIDFEESTTPALPLHFWMFQRCLDYLHENPKRFIQLGAQLQPPYKEDSLEGIIWKEPYPLNSSYKASPHVMDIIVLAGLAEYGKVKNPKTGRRVQGAKIII
ncbi:MAG: hypothetical protein JRJ62_12960 [Deltaproteobacteria bacterium]|nr:hypothetical protein [Deltaproteobacteria bacterium]